MAAADAVVTFEEVIELPEEGSDDQVAIVAQQVRHWPAWKCLSPGTAPHIQAPLPSRAPAGV